MRTLTLFRTKSIAARCVRCLVSGAIYAVAFAPWSAHLWGLTALLFGLGLIVSAQRPAQAAFFGFLFALAAFTIGLEWSVRSMHEFGRLPLVLAWVGEVLLAAVCALCWAAAAWVAIWLTPSRKALRWIALALTLTAAEWLRGAGGLDFGWLTPALATLDTPWASLAPLGGTMGVTFALLLSLTGVGALMTFLFSAFRRRRLEGSETALAVGIAIVVLGLSFWSGRQLWSTPGPAVALRLVQMDLPVVDGWTRPDSVTRLVETTKWMETPWEAAQKDLTRVVLTPEGILSADSVRPSAALRAAMGNFAAAAQGPVLFNGFRRGTEGNWYNSAFFVDAENRVATVDKRKLVPFGEFIPAGFRWFVDLLGIPLSDLAPGKPEQPNLNLGRGIYAGLLICYENIDGEVLRSFWADPERDPGIFFVTANLGWFAPSIIPQHLDMTRLLALASARPAASVNMNGRSAVVNARAEVVFQAPVSGRAVLDASLPTGIGNPTPFVRWGNIPTGIFWGCLLLLWALMRLRGHFSSNRTSRQAEG